MKKLEKIVNYAEEVTCTNCDLNDICTELLMSNRVNTIRVQRVMENGDNLDEVKKEVSAFISKCLAKDELAYYKIKE